MTSPIPYGLHVISGELTDQDTDRILSEIHRFLTYKEAAQLENLKQVYDLPDGGYFIVQHSGGIFRVIADKQEPEKLKFINDGLVKLYIPMFFSGVIETPMVRLGEKLKLKLTEICRNRLSRSLDRAIPKTIELERFNIEQNYKFTEFISQANANFLQTQYQAHNPGWYSGSMAKIHQFVGGYGRQDVDQLPEDELERIQFKLPEKLLVEFAEKYNNVRLPGYTGVPPITGEFQYNYRAHKTDAVAFDDQNRPWLIRVADKVYAMPLPIIPLTADPAFHTYIEEEVQDAEILEILGTFKAMPSGESFPDDQQVFQQWVRAGVIIEICDNSIFRNHIPMFPACGWSFNNRGNIAYNTAYKYNSIGIIECTTFRLSLSMVGSKHHYGTESVQVSTELSDNERNTLSRYLSQLNSALSNEGDLAKVIKYKLRHINQAEILSRASINFDAETEINYWDQYRCNPIANHSGKIIELYRGKLFHPAGPKAQPQIKFPYYEAGLCISFDFSPLEPGPTANCDTIMYIYFDNDSVKAVKYFYTEKDFTKEVDTDYDAYMTVGSWYKNETEGKSTIAGHFYLTDIDDRDEIAPTIKRTTVKGVDKGYDSKPMFSYDAHFWRPGTMWRNRYFTHLTKTKTTIGKELSLAILVPMFNRSTVLHAKKEYSARMGESEILELNAIVDPYSYRYWTHDSIFAWAGGLEKAVGKPYPVSGNPVWVEIEKYDPHPGNDFANSGPWVAGLPADYTWLIHPDANEWLHNGGGGPPKVNTYSNSAWTNDVLSGDLKWPIAEKIISLSTKKTDERYFLPSPDEYGEGMARTSSRVFLGQSEYANISETNEAGFWKYTGYSNLVNHSKAYHFIGVINE